MTLYLEAKIHFFQRLFKYHRNFSNDFSAVRRNFSNEFCRSGGVSRKVLVFPVNQADYDLYHRVHLVRMALGNHQCQGHEGGVGDAL